MEYIDIHTLRIEYSRHDDFTVEVLSLSTFNFHGALFFFFYARQSDDAPYICWDFLFIHGIYSYLRKKYLSRKHND